MNSSRGMGKVTRSGLTPGKLITSSKDENPVSPAIEVNFLFNPTDYKLSKSNTWTEQSNDQQQGDKQYTFTKSGAITLTLKLHFDTLMAPESRDKPYDVRYHTDDLWRMMERKKSSSESPSKEPPPLVEFQWGELIFVAFITKMDQDFTLFREDGVPVRCEVTVNLTQFDPNTSVTIENVEAPKPVTVIDSSRVDLLAALSLGMTVSVASSATTTASTIAQQARSIAENNDIDNPLVLQTGSQINTTSG